MTDGEAGEECLEQNTGDPREDAVQAAIDAKNEFGDDLIIHSVGVGANVDEENLTKIAEIGGGEFFSAATLDQLPTIYETIGTRIKSIQVSKHIYNYILFVFYTAKDSYTEVSSDIPEVLGRKDYTFNLDGKLEGEITKIEIYPKIVSESGKETIGPLMDSWKP
jgi:hypothetical protein